MKKRYFIFSLLMVFCVLGATAQKTYRDSTSSSVAVQRLIINGHATGLAKLGLVTNNDTVWFEADAGDLDIQLDGDVTINGTPIGGSASDVAYDATTWNGNTDAATKNVIRDQIEVMVDTTDALRVDINNTDYSFDYKQDTYEQEITDGETLEFVGRDGINLYTRSILAGGAQLTMVASQKNQWFDYSVIYDSGLTYDITPGYHFIQGVFYSIDATSVITLDAAHATLNRTDVIAVDTNENVIKITGTPAADPAKPLVDPLSQLELTHVDVAAGATTPGIDTETVYDENTEWTTSSAAVSNITVDFDNATSPQSGSKCIKISHDTGGSISGGNAAFTDVSTNSASDKSITFYLKTTGEWRNRTQLNFNILDGSSRIGVFVMSKRTSMYGFNDELTTWQRVSINFDDITMLLDEFDKITVYALSDWTDGVVLYMDKIELQDEISETPIVYNLLTQNNETRTTLSVPGDDAANIIASGYYAVGATTSNVPTGVEGIISAMYRSNALTGMIYTLIDEDTDDMYISTDKGSNWTKYLVDSGTTFYSSAGTVNNSYEGETTNLASSGALTLGNVVYISGNNAVANADANGSSTYPAIGVVVDATNKTILTRGYFTQTDSTFTANDPIYLSTTAGEFTSVAPAASTNAVQLIGRAVDANTVKFDFKDGIIILK